MKCVRGKRHLWSKWQWPVSDSTQYRQCLRDKCGETQVRVKGRMLRRVRKT